MFVSIKEVCIKSKGAEFLAQAGNRTTALIGLYEGRFSSQIATAVEEEANQCLKLLDIELKIRQVPTQ